MRIAITGGTGFVGRHLARELAAGGHEVVIVARGADRRNEDIFRLPGAKLALVGTGDEEKLAEAFAGCEAVAHCAGINREIGAQTYRRVHVEGTHRVVAAARRSGVRKIALLSFLRARPACGSPYHESKWKAEEIVRGSGLDHTILKSGMIYGRGDHMLDHTSHALHTFPVFVSVGMKDSPIRPVAVEDVVRILVASLVEGRLARQTVAVTGPEVMAFGGMVRRVARVLGRRPLMLRAPVLFHRVLARIAECLMTVPLVSVAQVRMLQEGVADPSPPCDALPEDLAPRVLLTDDRIRAGLPAPGGFGRKDFRFHRGGKTSSR